MVDPNFDFMVDPNFDFLPYMQYIKAVNRLFAL